jgi:cytochrome c peroxidase
MKHLRLLLILVVAACGTVEEDTGPAPVLPETPFHYDPPLPPHAQASLGGVPLDNTPPDNPITDAGATLGRVLFFDLRLSANESTACASCHVAATGFADATAASTGFDGGATARNAMPTLEVRRYARGRMFWDERATSLEEQVLAPIQNEVEMGMTLDDVVARVEATAFYPDLFAAAFGDDEVTVQRISLALAQYVRSIDSFGSKWDQGVTQVASIADDFPNFTAEENRGKTIFFGQHDPTTHGLCGSCHMAGNPLAARPPGAPPIPFVNVAFFVPFGPTDNGLPPLEGDRGVGGVTNVAATDNLFKPPSLRDVALTAPYMHDGRFATLEQVVDYYDHGITATPNLHIALRDADGAPLRLHLTPEDRAALVAFLGTLSDPQLVTDPRFASPFP